MNDVDIFVAVYLLCVGLFGMYDHYRTAKIKGRTLPPFHVYLFKHSPKKTGTAFGALVATIGGLFSTSAFDAVQFEAAWEALKNYHIYGPLALASVTSYSAGYVCDSKWNDKGEK